MKSSKVKLGLALAASLIVGYAAGFAGGFATKSCVDFFRPAITTAYSGAVVSPRSLHPVSYGGFFEPFTPFEPFDFPVAPFDLNNSFSQISNVPSIRTEDTEKELKLIATLPGVEQKNVQVDIQPNFLTIKGNQVDKEGGHIVKSESFVRSMNLPNNVDSRRAQQDFKDGVLTISIPKIDAGATHGQQKTSMTSASI